MKFIMNYVPGIAMFCCITSFHLVSQKNDIAIDNLQKRNIADSAISLLKQNYIFPERIAQIETVIQSKFLNNEYSGFNTLFSFLDTFNKDLEASSKDKHLNIFFGPQIVRKLKNDIKASDSNTSPPEYLKLLQYENFRLRSVERLDGNIGYFKFNGFIELEHSKEAILSAMNFLSNCSALILDLRENGGGSAETSIFLMSYFLSDSTKLGVFRSRKDSTDKVLWTNPDRQIKKFLNKPLYILTSSKTSSAAEGLSYGLQKFNRAKIIGEQTHGEANPGYRFIIDDKLYMMIPTFININSVTGTNWDGTGVIPDIRTSANDAFPIAMIEACNNLSKESDHSIYDWIIPEYEAQLNPEYPSLEIIKKMTGNYDDDKSITSEKGILYFTSGSSRRKLNYMGNYLFSVDGRKDYRLKVLKDDSTRIEILWNDESKDHMIKKI